MASGLPDPTDHVRAASLIFVPVPVPGPPGDGRSAIVDRAVGDARLPRHDVPMTYAGTAPLVVLGGLDVDQAAGSGRVRPWYPSCRASATPTRCWQYRCEDRLPADRTPGPCHARIADGAHPGRAHRVGLRGATIRFRNDGGMPGTPRRAESASGLAAPCPIGRGRVLVDRHRPCLPGQTRQAVAADRGEAVSSGARRRPIRRRRQTSSVSKPPHSSRWSSRAVDRLVFGRMARGGRTCRGAWPSTMSAAARAARCARRRIDRSRIVASTGRCKVSRIARQRAAAGTWILDGAGSAVGRRRTRSGTALPARVAE